MGVDFLDLRLRLEKAFDIKLPNRSVEEAFDMTARDVQAGRLHEMICRRVTEAGRAVPHSSWHRVQLCIARASGKPPKQIRHGTWLCKELEMC